MSKVYLLLGLMLVVMLAACDSSSQPTATPKAPGPQPTSGEKAPTATAPASSNIIGVATPAGTFVVPAVQPTTPPKPVRLSVESNGISPAADIPNIGKELNADFKAFYDARTLTKESYFDVETIRGLTDEPYRDYTVTLLKRDETEADAGKLLEVTYSNIGVKVDKWEPAAGGKGKGTATASVTRTKKETRKGYAPTTSTSSVRFKLQRTPVSDAAGNAVTWLAVDVYDEGLGKWVSENVPPATKDVEKEIAGFFQEFYDARTLAPGHKFDIDKTRGMTAFAYQDYTIPLLQRQQEEADSGKLTSVTYSDLKTVVQSWYPEATSHGGIATVQVTRTVKVTRPSGSEQPKTETFQFRLHRHWDENDHGLWLAVDFFSPATGKWVSESAGLSAPVPASGHG